MLSVPKVWVTPGPAVRRPALTVVLAVTVGMLLTVRAESLSSSSVPPPSVRAPVPNASGLPLAHRTPALTVEPPENELVPVR